MSGRPDEVRKDVKVVDQIRVVGFAGSLRRGSFNKGVIRAAAESAPSGLLVQVFDLADIPLYNQDIEDAGEPASVVALKQAIAGADALLVATPEYNHGIPGVLKNALDWASRPRATSPLRDKPVAVTGASTGTGSTARAQAQLREAFVLTGACVMPLPELLIGAAASRFDDDGNLTDSEVRASLVELLEALRAWAVRLRLKEVA
jgi:chromate reductase, NAD(P)H dehydrogenase (quinone)